MKNFLLAAAAALLISGCAGTQYPWLACNPGIASGVAGPVAMMLTSSIPVVGGASAVAMAGCAIEAAIANGTPATTTKTSSTSTTTTASK